jgi:hypothetical protein
MRNWRLKMDREKGMAYCGLACCVCSENTTCSGCRNEGCTDKEWCKAFHCCKTKGLNGCWECSEFPCEFKILDSIRVRTFAKFISEFGEDKLMDTLERNEKKGIIYHYEGKITGDYDNYQTEEEIRKLLLED